VGLPQPSEASIAAGHVAGLRGVVQVGGDRVAAAGQVSAAALSHTVMTMDSGGAPARLNSSQLLLRKAAVSMPALASASSAKGLMRPLGALPALCACTSRPSLPAQWSSMPSASTLRAELWVQRTRTWTVIGRLSSAGGAVGCGCDGGRGVAAQTLAAMRREVAEQAFICASAGR
jgi:hypothetical protein